MGAHTERMIKAAERKAKLQAKRHVRMAKEAEAEAEDARRVAETKAARERLLIANPLSKTSASGSPSLSPTLLTPASTERSDDREANGPPRELSQRLQLHDERIEHHKMQEATVRN